MKRKAVCFISFVMAIYCAVSFSFIRAFAFSFRDVPQYGDRAYVEVNGNAPFFTEDELTVVSFEIYGELDSLGRCTAAYANVGTDIMPTEQRGAIGKVKPTGWQSVKYDIVDGKYLYNRCHLIGYQLSAENANRRNLITGTRYLNVTGMLPFENMVADYVKETENHVLYRVTPVFEGEELVARGVLMEAYSVEDEGDGICFCVYCYNVQPGIVIDYATGESRLESGETVPEPKTYTVSRTLTFTVNTRTRRFHMESCSSVEKTSEKNKAFLTCTSEDLIAEGYKPCSVCRPDINSGTVTYFYGDADLNGVIEAADARLTLRAAVGIEELDSVQTVLADTYYDNKITSADARRTLRAAVGLDMIT